MKLQKKIQCPTFKLYIEFEIFERMKGFVPVDGLQHKRGGVIIFSQQNQNVDLYFFFNLNKRLLV